MSDRVLVTGATGFIGGHLVARLRAEGAEVHVLGRADPPAKPPGVRWWRADVADREAVKAVVQQVRPGVIYHLASHVVGARALDAVGPTLAANLLGTIHLLLAAAETGGPRLVLTGSLEEPEPAMSPPVPSSPYAAAKWAAGGYARMFHALWDVPVVLLRLFMVYGPAQRDLNKLVPYVTLALLRGEAPRLASGTRPVDWIYVDDVVEAILRAGRASDVIGETLDVGSGELVAVRTVVETLVELVNPSVTPAFGALPDRPMEQVRQAQVGATTALLEGWRPLVPLREGLARTAAWYAEAYRRGSIGCRPPA